MFSSRSMRLWKLMLLIAPFVLDRHVASAQGERVRVVVVQGAPTVAAQEFLDGFRRRLEQAGRTAEIRTVTNDGTLAITHIATALAPPSLVLALGSRAVEAVRDAHTDAPVIGALLAGENSAQDKDIARITLEFPLDVELEWLHRVLPGVRRIGILYSTDANAVRVAQARDVGKALGFEIVARRVTSPAEIPAALAALASGADVLWGIPDDIVLTTETAKAVLLASLRNRVPFVGLSAQWVRAGALYALERDYADLGAQSADIAIRILDGTSPRAIGVVRPRKVTYVLNARTAALVNVSLSADLLRGASEVVR
ncbi:MAG: ABC transporter substrate binding protein [Gemmatimonas sp.]